MEAKMIRKNNLKITYLLSVICLWACTNNTGIENDQRNIEKIKQDSIISTLNKYPQIQLEFLPTDTIFRLSSEIEIVIFRNSFIKTDSTPFNDKVNITLDYSNTLSKILSNQIQYSKFTTENLKGILKFEVKDQNGNPLLINPKYSTLIRFHPDAHMMNSSYFMFDTIKNQYSTLQYGYNIYKNGECDTLNRESPYQIDFSFLDTSLKPKRNIRHKGKTMNKQEIIAYELTLKQSGFYFINWDDKNENLQNASIIINTVSKEQIENINNVKMFVFTQNKLDNYYLIGESIDNGKYKIKHSPYHNELKLPLNRKYTLFAYCLDKDKCYFFMQKNISLQPKNEFSIQLEKISFNRLLKELKEL